MRSSVRQLPSQGFVFREGRARGAKARSRVRAACKRRRDELTADI